MCDESFQTRYDCESSWLHAPPARPQTSLPAPCTVLTEPVDVFTAWLDNIEETQGAAAAAAQDAAAAAGEA